MAYNCQKSCHTCGTGLTNPADKPVGLTATYLVEEPVVTGVTGFMAGDVGMNHEGSAEEAQEF